MAKWPTTYRRSIQAPLRLLIPSFLQRDSASPTKPGKSPNRVRVLDGVRGIACLIVCHSHICHMLGYPMFYSATWDRVPLFFQYPWIHLFWNGHAMVWTFFTLSGYAIAYKPLKLIYAAKQSELIQVMSSSLIRRGFRLYLPALACIYIVALITWLGAFEPGRTVETDPSMGKRLELPENIPDRLPTLYQQLRDACTGSLNLLNLWEGESRPGKYNDHYWAISTQYRASLLVFVVLLASSGMNSRYLPTFLWTMTALSFYVKRRAELVAHFGGVALANADIMLAAVAQSQLPKDGLAITKQAADSARSFTRSFFAVIALILGTLFMSVPYQDMAHHPVSHYITLHVPFVVWPNTNHGTNVMGAILTIYAILRLPWTHILFTNKYSAYLATISFSVYLVHGPIIRAVLWPSLPYLYRWAGTVGPLSKSDVTAGQFLFVWTASLMLIVPLTIIIADLFQRVVQVPCANFTAWIEKSLNRQ